ncbi:galactosyl transferase [Methylobacter sp.]|uniref:galactosyl transferase n=1 Tax=Methylobacter sp. TaxID=2051955 RepID=UPI002489D14B|nr:galactosyl transferase [Methylobacter sp.]MDI1277314.1 galactosyl transferase [Methylobacter sp.]MDI1357894.1 galactosyl transferase [Methylobacter sp.]
MKTFVTFIIPVRHQDNSKNWGLLKANLTQTIASIAAQTNKNWRAVIVANEGADLPDVPDGFEIVRVNFPPNLMHDAQGNDKEVFYDAFRIDKGRRVLKGMLHARETAFYMIVDDDDFVSNGLVEFVSQNITANGWKINEGYIWGDGGNLLFIHHDFANFCGTSLIIRSDLYHLPDSFESATDEYIKTMLGSHVRIGQILAAKGTPLASLPFRGAVYRIGHAGAHSKSPKFINLYFFNKYLILRPHKLLRNLFNLRFVDGAFKKKYFGAT